MIAAKKITPMYLQDLLLVKLQSLNDVESELIKALPRLVKHATDNALAEAFSLHLNETKTQAERLSEIFSLLDKKPAKLQVMAIRGMAEDVDWLIRNVSDLAARDAALVAAGCQVEQYEMATYETAISWAELLGFNDVRDLLQQNLVEEQEALEKLRGLGEQGIYESAIGDDTETEFDGE
ncbi:MAG: DUF892 family protein [Patescibacteria group bacterium]|nr:DUF892 family protein [Patescibacteria group bacterium]MDE2172532.1 DUF892 family protein [Patescibacteria group bacterium]